MRSIFTLLCGNLLAGAFLLTGCGGAGAAGGPGPSPGQGGGALPTSLTLGPDEARDLLFMREEEKLARDVYLALADHWRPQAEASALVALFGNISRSEQQHMDRLKALLAAAGLADPVDGAETRGRFTDPVLAQLYADLIAAGGTSVAAAGKVGALIEEKDIDDLNRAIAATRQSTLVSTYGGLKCGSGNHLRGFVAPLQSEGSVYAAQVLTQAEVTAILADPGGPCGWN